MTGRVANSAGTRRRGLMRDEFLDAAARVFARRGYHGSSTKEIALEIGMAQSSIYYYFPSKEAALEEVCFRAVEGYVQRLEEIIAGPGSKAEKLRGAILAHLEPARTRMHLYQTFVNSRQFLPAPARKRVGRLTRRYEEIFGAFLKDGVADGAFRADLDCEATLLVILGACNSAAVTLQGRLDGDVDRFAKGMADMVLGGVVGR
jgi:AcrR family transcriptional regulator